MIVEWALYWKLDRKVKFSLIKFSNKIFVASKKNACIKERTTRQKVLFNLQQNIVMKRKYVIYFVYPIFFIFLSAFNFFSSFKAVISNFRFSYVLYTYVSFSYLLFSLFFCSVFIFQVCVLG